MRLYINDRYGSHLLGVLRLDGTPAVENTDYSKFTSDLVIDKPFNYRKKGVTLRNGIVITKDYQSGRVYEIIINRIEDGMLVATQRIEKPLHHLGEKPLFNSSFSEIRDEILEVALTQYSKRKRAKIVNQWQQMEAAMKAIYGEAGVPTKETPPEEEPSQDPAPEEEPEQTPGSEAE